MPKKMQKCKNLKVVPLENVGIEDDCAGRNKTVRGIEKRHGTNQTGRILAKVTDAIG